MAFMKSVIAFALFWVNLIVALLILYFSIKVKNSNYLNRSSYNLLGTKEIFLEINQNYFLEKEIETQKEFRNLASRNFGNIILFVDLGAFAFIILLMVTFCLTKNECCTNDENVRANCIGELVMHIVCVTMNMTSTVIAMHPIYVSKNLVFVDVA